MDVRLGRSWLGETGGGVNVGRINRAQNRTDFRPLNPRFDVVVHACLSTKEAEFDLCSTVQSLRCFASGTYVWEELPAVERCRQLLLAAQLLAELYPATRWYLWGGVA